MIYLMIEFFKIGLFAIGGGLATIPFLQELSYSTGWFTLEELTMMIAVSESTPGPIGVNMATYIGNHVAGILGGVLATLSLVAPSFILVCLAAKGLQRWKDNKQVQIIFYGLKPAVFALITFVTLEICQLAQILPKGFDFNSISLVSVFMYIVLFGAQKKWNFHPIFLIITSGILGLIFKL